MIALADAREATREVETFRIRQEYLEMPGLRLTIEQAARLFGVSMTAAADALHALEAEGFLRISIDPHQSIVYRRS